MSKAAHNYLDDIERDWKVLGGWGSLFNWISFCFGYVVLPLVYATVALGLLAVIGRLTYEAIRRLI